MVDKILQGKIDVINDTSMKVEIYDAVPNPDEQLVAVPGFSDPVKAKEYILGLESLNHKSEEFLAGIAKAIELHSV